MTQVRSFLPGSIQVLYFEDGDRVEAGDKVAGVECMKMLNDIETPAGGVIRYRVKLGQVIAQNDVVADVS